MSRAKPKQRSCLDNALPISTVGKRKVLDDEVTLSELLMSRHLESRSGTLLVVVGVVLGVGDGRVPVPLVLDGAHRLGFVRPLAAEGLKDQF